MTISVQTNFDFTNGVILSAFLRDGHQRAAENSANHEIKFLMYRNSMSLSFWGAVMACYKIYRMQEKELSAVADNI